MARPKTIPFRDTLCKLFPAVLLATLARESRAVIRQRKVDIVKFFWALVLGYGTGRERTLAGLRAAYEKATRTKLASSAYQKRFTAGLVRMLKRAVTIAFEQAKGIGRELRGPLAAFEDVLLTDGTVVRLHDLLEKAFPGSRTNHSKAAVKLHPVMSIRGAGNQTVRMTSGRTNDGPVLKVGKWVRDRLLMFDLGYFRYHLFACIARNGGFFLTRLKSSANPLIVRDNRTAGKGARSLVGMAMKEAKAFLTGDVVDFEVEVAFTRRLYKGARRRDTQRLRVVGLLNPYSGEYHLYMTNVPPEKLAAEDVGMVYAARWAIEIAFKRLKTSCRLEDMPSRKKETVEALLYSALLTMLVADELLHVLRRKLAGQAERLKSLRWVAVFERISSELLYIVTHPAREVRILTRSAAALVYAEALDPNASRPDLLTRVETRTHSYRPKS